MLSLHGFNLVGDEGNKNVLHFYFRDDTRGEATLSRYGFRFEEKDGDFLGYGNNTLDVSREISSSLYYAFAGYYGVERGAFFAMGEEAHIWSNRRTNQGFALHARIMINSIYPTFNYYDWYGFSLRFLIHIKA